MDKIDDVTKKIFGKQKRDLTIIDSWHILMRSYGWIPYDEFFELDASIVSQLHLCIQEDDKNQPKIPGVKN